MALVTGDDYEDLVEWVETIATDTITEKLLSIFCTGIFASSGAEAQCADMGKVVAREVAEGFEQMLVNHYGED